MATMKEMVTAYVKAELVRLSKDLSEDELSERTDWFLQEWLRARGLIRREVVREPISAFP